MVKVSSKFAKTFGKKEILVPHLNNWFAAANFPDTIPVEIHPNKEKDDAFHPSSALDCALVLYAKRRQEFPDRLVSFDSQKTFMYGHFIHGLIYYIVQDLGFSEESDIEQEHDFYQETDQGNKYRIRGFVDVAKCVIPGQTAPVLVDVKSQNARIYAQNEQPAALLEKYIAQVRLYLDFTGLNKAIILWAEKDSPHRFKETVVMADDDFVDEIYSKWDYVVDCEVDGDIPTCTCGLSNCPAKDLYV